MADFDLDAFLASNNPAASLAAYQDNGLYSGTPAGASAMVPYQGQDVQFASAQAGGLVPTSVKKMTMGKAVRLLGAAVTYFGADALSSFLPSIAAQLGKSSFELLSGFLNKKGRGGRRRRGITYRQLSNARRVNRTIDRMYHSLHKGGGGGYRRRAPPFHHHRKGKR